MKFFSVKNFGKRFENAIGRFPIAIFFAVFCSICLIILTENIFDFEDDLTLLFKLIIISGIGVPLFVAFRLWSETIQNKFRVYSMYALGFIFLALPFFYLPQRFYEIEYSYNAQLLGYFISFHLFASIAAYLFSGSNKSFWEFNISTFLSFLESAFYGLILFLGLSLAYASIDILFNVDLDDQIYEKTFIVIAGILHPFYFLSELRKTPHEVTGSFEHHRIFGFFSKFILLPLTLIYFGILYAFSIKLLVEGEWSKGWISSLILGFSVTGILCYLFNYFLVQKEKSIITIFLKWFFPALLPMAAVLFLAVRVRFQEYGLTENRYIGFISAFWLILISLYFIISKKKQLKIIPASLFIIVFLISIGPLSLTQQSVNSQVSRMAMIFEKNDLLSEGKLKGAVSGISDEDKDQVSSIIDFLDDRKRLWRLGQFNSDQITIVNTIDRNNSWGEVAKNLGIEDHNPGRSMDDPFFKSFFPNHRVTIPIANFDYVQRIDVFSYDVSEANSDDFKLDLEKENMTLSVSDNEETIIEFNLSTELERIYSLDAGDRNLGFPELSINLVKDGSQVMIVIETLTLEKHEDQYYIETLTGQIYLKIEENE